MRPRISIRGSVRPSVRPSVRLLVGDAFTFRPSRSDLEMAAYPPLFLENLQADRGLRQKSSRRKFQSLAVRFEQFFGNMKRRFQYQLKTEIRLVKFQYQFTQEIGLIEKVLKSVFTGDTLIEGGFTTFYLISSRSKTFVIPIGVQLQVHIDNSNPHLI